MTAPQRIIPAILVTLAACGCGKLNKERQKVALRANGASESPKEVKDLPEGFPKLVSSNPGNFCQHMKDVVAKFSSQHLTGVDLEVGDCSSERDLTKYHFSMRRLGESLDFVFELALKNSKVPGYKKTVPGIEPSLKLAGSGEEFRKEHAPFLLHNNMTTLAPTLKRYFTWIPSLCLSLGRRISDDGTCSAEVKNPIARRAATGDWEESKYEKLETPGDFVWDTNWPETTKIPGYFTDFLSTFVGFLNKNSQDLFSIESKDLQVVHSQQNLDGKMIEKSVFKPWYVSPEKLSKIFGNDPSKKFTKASLNLVAFSFVLNYQQEDEGKRAIRLFIFHGWNTLEGEKLFRGTFLGVSDSSLPGEARLVVRSTEHDTLDDFYKQKSTQFSNFKKDPKKDLFHPDLSLLDEHLQNWSFAYLKPYPSGTHDHPVATGTGESSIPGEFAALMGSKDQKLKDDWNSFQRLVHGSIRLKDRRVVLKQPEKFESAGDSSVTDIPVKLLKSSVYGWDKAREWCSGKSMELVTKAQMKEVLTVIKQSTFGNFSERMFVSLFDSKPSEVSEEKLESRFFLDDHALFNQSSHVLCLEKEKDKEEK